ncbi:bola protein [Dipodascopsis tothii]|uniref:bola protein n=1 Tax=Dipodascopsis tothii TaxID=44089 RepID=UPI0034CF4760
MSLCMRLLPATAARCARVPAVRAARPATRVFRAAPAAFAVRGRFYSVSAEPAALVKDPAMNEYEAYLFDMLAKALEPTRLSVQDISGGCGSMFAIDVGSTKFKGIPMIKQHRMVNEILQDEIKKWHGVKLSTKAV